MYETWEDHADSIVARLARPLTTNQYTPVTQHILDQQYHPAAQFHPAVTQDEEHFDGDSNKDGTETRPCDLI
jgi:hypothetical protein